MRNWLNGWSPGGAQTPGELHIQYSIAAVSCQAAGNWLNGWSPGGAQTPGEPFSLAAVHCHIAVSCHAAGNWSAAVSCQAAGNWSAAVSCQAAVI